MHIFTNFKSRKLLYQLHIYIYIYIYMWYCMSPPLAGINFYIFWYNLILPISVLTERLSTIQILKKVQVVCRKINFTCFRCRTDARWVIDKYRLTQISSKYMLGYLIVLVQINPVQKDILEPSILQPSSACISLHVSIVSKWNLGTIVCIMITPPPPLYAIAK